jgi:hypothetical protein
MMSTTDIAKFNSTAAALVSAIRRDTLREIRETLADKVADTSATADQHVVGYRAGFNAMRDDVLSEIDNWLKELG